MTLEMAKKKDDEVILYLRKENALLQEIAARHDARAEAVLADRDRSLWNRIFGATETTAVNAGELAEPPRMTASKSERLAAELTATKPGNVASPESRTEVPQLFESRSANIQSSLAEAQTAEAAGEDDRASELYRRVLAAEPNNLMALSNLGVVQFRQGNLPDAEKNLRRAVALAPNDSEARALLGIVYFRTGKIEQAFSELTRAIALNPRHAQAHNFLGITLSQKGWDVAAEGEIRRAIELDPQYADAHFNLAVLYAVQQQPRYDLARDHYQTAVALGAAKDADLEKLLAP